MHIPIVPLRGFLAESPQLLEAHPIAAVLFAAIFAVFALGILVCCAGRGANEVMAGTEIRSWRWGGYLYLGVAALSLVAGLYLVIVYGLGLIAYGAYLAIYHPEIFLGPKELA